MSQPMSNTAHLSYYKGILPFVKVIRSVKTVREVTIRKSKIFPDILHVKVALLMNLSCSSWRKLSSLSEK
jgi:hypothetical protein